MTAVAEIDNAIWHVRRIGGNRSIRDVLSRALGERAIALKRELRAVAMGCGDDYVASSIEKTLKQDGVLPASY